MTDRLAQRTYSTVDKSGWMEGPWKAEPDKVQFVDDATGFPCLIVRGPSGALCGYVGVAEGHPYFGHDYCSTIPSLCTCDGGHREYGGCKATPEGFLTVHGGITYSDFCQEGPEETAICHVPQPGGPDRVYWFGFDCAHYQDVSPKYDDFVHTGGAYRDVAYLRAECADLAQQLAGLLEPTL